MCRSEPHPLLVTLFVLNVIMWAGINIGFGLLLKWHVSHQTWHQHITATALNRCGAK